MADVLQSDANPIERSAGDDLRALLADCSNLVAELKVAIIARIGS
jgi:hypothetical protein